MDSFIKQYQAKRWLFYSLIRPQEAYLFKQHMKYVRSPSLDFGCNDGFFAETVFGKGKIDVGIDIKRIPNRVYKRLTNYNGQRLPFNDRYFSTVISNCVLEHIPNLNESLQEINRMLKPGGHLLTTVMTDKWNTHLFGTKIFGNRYSNFMQHKQQHRQLLSKIKWDGAFRQNGFRIIKTIGYLSPKNASYLDLFHYLSLIPFINKFVTVTSIKHLIRVPTSTAESAALFYILRK